MSYKELVIINNEKISKEKNNFYCDNIDIKTLPEDLNENFKVTLVARNSHIKRDRKINLEKIKIGSNIFSFLCNIYKTFDKDKKIYLIISVTPYTFFSRLLLFFFKKKTFIYLRSDGHEEYKAILGFIGPALYHLMFRLTTFKSIIISCQERLFDKNKSHIVFPSELNSLWLKNLRKPPNKKPKLLYVGRLKIEKGIFSLLKITNQLDDKINLSIAGKIEKNQLNTNNWNNINYIGHINNINSLIETYDNHNIFILPSFTEAHPKVIDESLARGRPVIIFEEIKHVIGNKKGVFVSKRNKEDLIKTINYIMKNYYLIQKEMNQNHLPTKSEFISKMTSILISN